MMGTYKKIIIFNDLDDANIFLQRTRESSHIQGVWQHPEHKIQICIVQTIRERMI